MGWRILICSGNFDREKIITDFALIFYAQIWRRYIWHIILIVGINL